MKSDIHNKSIESKKDLVKIMEATFERIRQSNIQYCELIEKEKRSNKNLNIKKSSLEIVNAIRSEYSAYNILNTNNILTSNTTGNTHQESRNINNTTITKHSNTSINNLDNSYLNINQISQITKKRGRGRPKGSGNANNISKQKLKIEHLNDFESDIIQYKKKRLNNTKFNGKKFPLKNYKSIPIVEIFNKSEAKKSGFKLTKNIKIPNVEVFNKSEAKNSGFKFTKNIKMNNIKLKENNEKEKKKNVKKEANNSNNNPKKKKQNILGKKDLNKTDLALAEEHSLNFPIMEVKKKDFEIKLLKQKRLRSNSKSKTLNQPVLEIRERSFSKQKQDLKSRQKKISNKFKTKSNKVIYLYL